MLWKTKGEISLWKKKSQFHFLDAHWIHMKRGEAAPFAHLELCTNSRRLRAEPYTTQHVRSDFIFWTFFSLYRQIELISNWLISFFSHLTYNTSCEMFWLSKGLWVTFMNEILWTVIIFTHFLAWKCSLNRWKIFSLSFTREWSHSTPKSIREK